MGIVLSTAIGIPLLAGMGVWASYIAAVSDMSLCKETKWIQIANAITLFLMVPIAWIVAALVPVAGSLFASAIIGYITTF